MWFRSGELLLCSSRPEFVSWPRQDVVDCLLKRRVAFAAFVNCSFLAGTWAVRLQLSMGGLFSDIPKALQGSLLCSFEG